MTAASSEALQAALYAALAGDAALTALVDGRIYDEPVHLDAPGASTGPYVTLGDEQARDWSASGMSGSYHEADVSVHAPSGGFAAAKAIAAEVERVVAGSPLALASGAVITRVLRRARARRTAESGRRIDLRFEFRIQS